MKELIEIASLSNFGDVFSTEYDPPNYLYQGQEVNGQLMEYTTLPGTSRINGSIHGSFIGNGSLSNGCPHLHHKVSNGMNGLMNGGINGGTTLYPASHTNSLSSTHMDCDQVRHVMNVRACRLYYSWPGSEKSCQVSYLNLMLSLRPRSFDHFFHVAPSNTESLQNSKSHPVLHEASPCVKMTSI